MKLKYHFSIQHVGDNYMAVASGDDAVRYTGMLRMNEIGKRILELLDQETTIDSIVAQLASEYIGSEEHIRSEVIRFTEKLSKANLLN